MASTEFVVAMCVAILLVGSVHGNRPRKQVVGSRNDLKTRLESLEAELKVSKAHAHVMEQELAKLKHDKESNKVPGADYVITEMPSSPVTAVYTRWGRHVCEGADFVYEGIMSGAGRRFNGSGGNYLCLHTEPEWATYMDGDDSTTAGRGVIYGVEYHGSPDEIFDSTNLVGTTFVEQNVPCAVCESYRSKVLMFPGWTSCPGEWILEYWGYLMSDNHNAVRTEYVCMDHAPEARDGGSQPQMETSNIYHVEARCGSLPCPQYIDNREITCAVCSK